MIYGEDLSYVHEQGFADYGQAAGEEVLRRLWALDDAARENGLDTGPGTAGRAEAAPRPTDAVTGTPPGGLVVDLACGPGHFVARLVEAGYNALGVDISASMVELARVRAPNADFVCASIDDFELPDALAVTAIGEAFNYRSTERSEPGIDRLRRVFAQVASALQESRGLFVFDVLLRPANDDEVWNKSHSASGPDWTCDAEMREDADARTLTRRITVRRRVGGQERTSTETHVLDTLQRGEVLAALDDAGFTATALTSYGDYELPPRRCAFFARRN